MESLLNKIVQISLSLSDRDIDHALGGALALAWCTHQARATIDIDLNIFTGVENAPEVFRGFPAGVAWNESHLDRVSIDGQVRLFWDAVPVDVFFNTTTFHDELLTRIRWEQFGGSRLPFLSCTDLAIFKLFFNRSKDWVDLEEMLQIGSLDVDVVVGVLVRWLGPGDDRVTRLIALSGKFE